MNTSVAFNDLDITETKAIGMAESLNPAVLTDIYQQHNNIVIWKREQPEVIQQQAALLIEQQPKLNISRAIYASRIETDVNDTLPDLSNARELQNRISELVNMFSCLFDLPKVGLRLSVLDRAMCPRFHVDRVPCRLVTTFYGVGSQWLPHQWVNRQKLGHGSKGLSDEESGLYPNTDCIQTLNCGDVALLKGELWESNEGAGLVHRSPPVPEDEKRLLMTLDFLL
ncbi:MAG: DUF1826 domain-containing protein [Aestuariibacter sp.]